MPIIRRRDRTWAQEAWMLVQSGKTREYVLIDYMRKLSSSFV